MTSVTDFSKSMAQVIPGFDIVREIGSGSVAKVFLAVQKEIGREVAIKIMLPQFASDSRFCAEFLRETRVAARLNHRSIMPIYTAGDVEGCCYLTMEYMAAGSLRSKINQGMTETEALQTTLDLALALDFAHSKAVIHGSVKPENIFFREDGSVVIGDFGVAKVIHESFSESASSDVLDHYAPYMSLEQALARAADERSDIYSLGVVFYEMLTGEALNRANTSVFSVIKNSYSALGSPRLPNQFAHLQSLFEKMVARDPDGRYPSAKRLAEDLEQQIEGIGKIPDATLVKGKPSATPAPEPDAKPDPDSTIRLDMNELLAASAAPVKSRVAKATGEAKAQSSRKPVPKPSVKAKSSAEAKPGVAKSKVAQSPVTDGNSKPQPETIKVPLGKVPSGKVPLGKVTPRSLTLPAAVPPQSFGNQLTMKAKVILGGCVASILSVMLYFGMAGSSEPPAQLIRVGSGLADTGQSAGAEPVVSATVEPAVETGIEVATEPADASTNAEVLPPVVDDSEIAVSSEYLSDSMQPEIALNSDFEASETMNAPGSETQDQPPLAAVVEDAVEGTQEDTSEKVAPEKLSATDQMMVDAGAAMAENHLMVPMENSAYELYMKVLDKEPEHVGAKQGLGNIVDRYLVIASQHLNDGEMDQAEKFVVRALQVASQDKLDHQYELKAENQLVVIRRVRNLEATENLEHWLALLRKRDSLTVSELNAAYASYMAVLDLQLYDPKVEEARDIYARAFYELGNHYLDNEELETARELIAKGLQIDPKDEELRALEARWVRWHDAKAWVTE